ncbi:MAG: helix-turn-helix domain-containing protein, partial [Pyrinomonadaceae bacterium]
IRVKDLPERVQQYSLRGQGFTTDESGETKPLIPEEWSSLSAIEGHYVDKVLTHTGGNKQAAARILDVDRKTLDRMIKRHKISVGRVANLPYRGA